MMLSDVWDYVKSLSISEKVYMGKLDPKSEKSIGVYHSRHKQSFKTALGGCPMESYGIKNVTFLVHWNKSPSDTEKAAIALYDALRTAREVTVNGKTIKFIQLLTKEPIDVGTDDSGIYEMVVEAAVIYGKENKDE